MTHSTPSDQNLDSGRFRRIIEDTGAGYFSMDLEGRYTDVNPAFLQMYGFSDKSEVIGRHFSELQNPADLQDAHDIVDRLMAGEHSSREDFTRLKRDGSVGYHTFSANPIIEDGRVTGIEGFLIDTTDYKQANEQLGQARRDFENFFALIPDLACIATTDGYFKRLNPAWEAALGYSNEELLRTPLIEFIHPDDRQATIEEVLSQVAGKPTLRFSNRYRRKDGAYRLLEWRATPAVDGTLLFATARDVTERDRTQKQFQGITNSLPGIVFQFFARDNGERGMYYVSERSEAVFGLPREPLSNWYERFMACVPREDTPRVLASIEESIRSRSPWECEARFIKPSGKEMYLRGVSQPQRLENETIFNGILIDITDRKKLEDQFRQAQKLETVGRLAGGVAHDFNNLLTVINGYSGFLLNALSASDPLRRYAEEINSAGKRAASLTAQMLAFSRKQIIKPEALDLNAIVRDSQKMLRRLIGEDIELATSLAPALGEVMADSDQIHQVLMNLLVNARDAMPDGGKVVIETANIELEGRRAGLQPEQPAGSYVMLSVSDTGTGMDEHTRLNVFEPFFTTKEQGKGTGLGLSTVYGIVKQAGGWIAVDSKPGQGAIFKIHWPRHHGHSPAEHGEPRLNATPGGMETILIVEDQPEVRRLAKTMLTAYGYHVIEADNGAEALQTAAAYSGRIDLLLADIVLSGSMNGLETATALVKARPETAVLLMSGYTADVIASRGVRDPAIAYIAKPFTPDTLAAKVREVLNSFYRNNPSKL